MYDGLTCPLGDIIVDTQVMGAMTQSQKQDIFLARHSKK